MLTKVRGPLLRFLRVPPEPSIPAGRSGAAGDAGPLRVFRAAPSYFRYKLLTWCLKQAAALVGLLFGLAVATRFAGMLEGGPIAFLIYAAELLAWTLFLVQLPFSYVVLRLDFEMRWYILSDRSLRIREGILRLREKTMTFANIQQITIRRNPLQSLLGIADVRVRTAGGGGSGSGGNGSHGETGESLHIAYFRGVDNAEEIRDAIRERVRSHRGPDRGQPDGASAIIPRSAPAHRPMLPTAAGASVDGGAAALAAAAELRDEIRALALALRSDGSGGA